MAQGKLRDLWTNTFCRSLSHWAPRGWLITASRHLSGCDPKQMCEAVQWLSTSPGTRWGGGGELVEGDGWRQVDSCGLETAKAVWCSTGGIYAPTAAGSGSRIYLAAQRYHSEMRFQSEVPVWGCMAFQKGGQGILGINLATPAPGAKMEREYDT